MFFNISILFFLYYSGSSALNGVHPNYKKNDQWLYKKSKVDLYHNRTRLLAQMALSSSFAQNKIVNLQVKYICSKLAIGALDKCD